MSEGQKAKMLLRLTAMLMVCFIVEQTNGIITEFMTDQQYEKENADLAEVVNKLRKMLQTGVVKELDDSILFTIGNIALCSLFA